MLRDDIPDLLIFKPTFKPEPVLHIPDQKVFKQAFKPDPVPFPHPVLYISKPKLVQPALTIP
jgi:hypothetical protein